jgi:archaeal cell division control protein 6
MQIADSFFGVSALSKPISLTDFLDFEKTIFTNKQALKPNYQLRSISDIKHRDKEIRTYYEFLKDIFRGISPNNIFVYGKPGTGKTILSKWVLKEVIKEAANRDLELCVINVNCEKSKTENAIWQKINDSLPIPDGEERQKIGNSRSKHSIYFEHLINSYNGIILIVLDELDKADNPQIINSIIRTESEKSGNAPCVIGITNDLKLRERFSAHLISVLSENELIVPPYDAEQLGEILKARAEIAFKENTLEKLIIPLCAAYGAQEHGDARKAIDILRVAGELAEMRKSQMVEELDVKNANEKIEIDRVIEVVKTLPTQSKTVLLACIYSLASGNESTISNMYQIYKLLCAVLSTDILTQRRVTDLTNELDQLGVINLTLQYKGRYGRNKKILNVSSKSSSLEILLNDFRLQPIEKIPFEAFIPKFKNR